MSLIDAYRGREGKWTDNLARAGVAVGVGSLAVGYYIFGGNIDAISSFTLPPDFGLSHVGGAATMFSLTALEVKAQWNRMQKKRNPELDAQLLLTSFAASKGSLVDQGYFFEYLQTKNPKFDWRNKIRNFLNSGGWDSLAPEDQEMMSKRFTAGPT